MHEQLHWRKATFLKQQHHIPPYALRQKKQFTNKNQHGKWHHWNTWSSCQTHYLFHPAMRHGLLGDSATRKHAQAVQSVCKWWWLAGIVTTWNPNDPCFDWFRAFLWRVGALLFRKQDLGNHYISSTWFSWKEENFLSYSLPFWGDVLWRSVWRLKIWGPQPYGCPNPKRKRTISKWFRKFSQFAPGHYKEKKLVINRLNTLFFQLLPFLPILMTLAPIFAPVSPMKNIG